MRLLLTPILQALALVLLLGQLPRTRWSQALALVLLLGYASSYLLWRGGTLNTGGALPFALSLLLFLTEALYLAGLLVPFLGAPFLDPLQRRRQADALQFRQDERPPCVDLWMRVRDEPERIVRRAVLASRNLEGPAPSLLILDEGGRNEIRTLAAELGATYRQGPDGMNQALTEAGGELIAVVDCNFLLFPSFLARTVGFFREERVAVVQVPQKHFESEFYNRNLGA